MQVYLFIDESGCLGHSERSTDYLVLSCLKVNEPKLLDRIEIHLSESHAWNGLQFADVLAWSMFQKFEHKESRFIDLIDSSKREVFYVW
jgi:hypothetical protein